MVPYRLVNHDTVYPSHSFNLRYLPVAAELEALAAADCLIGPKSRDTPHKAGFPSVHTMIFKGVSQSQEARILARTANVEQLL